MYALISVVALITILIAEPVYSESLFDSSLNYIIKKQQELTDGALEFWDFYTDTIAYVMILPIVIYLIRFKDRARAFYYVMLVTSLCLTMNLGKLFYH